MLDLSLKMRSWFKFGALFVLAMGLPVTIFGAPELVAEGPKECKKVPTLYKPITGYFSKPDSENLDLSKITIGPGDLHWAQIGKLRYMRELPRYETPLADLRKPRQKLKMKSMDATRLQGFQGDTSQDYFLVEICDGNFGYYGHAFWVNYKDYQDAIKQKNELTEGLPPSVFPNPIPNYR